MPTSTTHWTCLLAALGALTTGCLTAPEFLPDPTDDDDRVGSDDDDDDDDATGTPGPAFDTILPEPALNSSVGIDAGDAAGGVRLHSGELVLPRTDLTVAARRLGFALERTWRSGSTASGPLGSGWDATIFARLVPAADGSVHLHDGTGRSFEFAPDGDFFTSPAGIYSVLRADEDGWTLRGPGGGQTQFDADGRLIHQSDPSGDVTTHVYDDGRLVGVIDEMGRTVTLAYDDDGHLVSVSDATGREVRFAYDGDTLVEARSPVDAAFPEGRIERYLYDDRDAPNLVAVIAPNEVADGSDEPWMQTTYGTDGTDRDRVIEQVIGGLNASGVPAGGALTYAYDFAPEGGPEGTFSVTEVTDRRGHVTRYFHDADGHALRAVESPDAGAWTTDWTYNADGQRTSELLPLGNRRLWTYDEDNPSRFAQGRLLSLSLLPDADRDADQDVITTSFTWDPIFGKQLSATTPRGHDPANVPADGGPTSAARYTTAVTYDWQEAAAAPPVAAAWGIDVDPTLLGKGDVNDDGRVDQARGNAIRVDAPTVHRLPGSLLAASDGSFEAAIVSRSSFDDFGNLILAEDPQGNVTTYAYHSEADPDGDGTDLLAGAATDGGGWLAEVVVDAYAGPRRREEEPPAAIATSFVYDAWGNVAEATDGLGHVGNTLHDPAGRVLRTEAPRVDPSQETGYLQEFGYDANGALVLTRVQDQTAHPDTHLPMVVAEHPWFEHTSVRDILGAIVEASRDASLDPSVPDVGEAQRLVSRFELDPNGNLIRNYTPMAVVMGQSDAVIASTWDERDQHSSLDRAGLVQSFQYDRNGNVVAVTDGLGSSEVSIFDGFDRVLGAVDRAGTLRTSVLDAAGNVLREELHGTIGGGGGTTLLAATESIYDEAGQAVQTDRELFVPAGHSLLSSAWIDDGALTPGDGRVTERPESDRNGRRVLYVDDDGAVTETLVDGAGRTVGTVMPLSQTDDSGAVVHARIDHRLDANGNSITVTETRVNPEGHVPPQVVVTHRVYDALNRTVRSTDALGRTQYRDFDSRGNVVATFDARGPLLADPLGLAPGMINDRGNARRYAYDGVGRRWMEVIELTESGEGRAPVIDVITLLTVHDANNRVVARIDGADNATSFDFDGAGLLVGQVNADGGSRAFSYDARGDLVLEVDENGSVHSYSRDDLGRVLEHSIVPNAAKTLAGGVAMLVGTTEQRFEYDGLGRLTWAFDNNDPADASDDREVSVKRDSLGRVLEEVQNGAVIGSSWASTDRVELDYPGTERIVFMEFDAQGQMTGLTNPTHLDIDLSFLTGPQECCCCGCDADGDGDDDDGGGDDPRRGGDGGGGGRTPVAMSTSVLNPSGWVPALTVMQQLDEDLTVVEQVATTPICGTGELSLTRDRNGGVVQTERMQASPQSWVMSNATVDLDSLGRPRMQSAFEETIFASPWGWQNAVTDTFVDQGFGPANTIDQVTVVQVDPFVGSESVESAPRSFSPTGEREGPQWRYNGSPGTGIRTEDPDFIYQWDGLDRLRTVRLASDPSVVVVSHQFDAWPSVVGGRRVRKEVTNSGELNGVTEMLWDDARVIEERDGDDVVLRQFIYGDALDELLAIDTDADGDGEPETMLLPVRDWNNSVTHLIDAAGGIAEFYSYDAWGFPTIRGADGLVELAQSAVGNPFLYTSRRWEPELGKYFYRARFYDPAAGEFLSRDPLGLWGDPGNLGSGMAYVGNRGANANDPSGLGVLDFLGKAASGAWDLITDPLGAPGKFADAWTATHTDPMAARAVAAYEATGSEGYGYAWAVGDLVGASYVAEGWERYTVEGQTLTGTQGNVRMGIGFAQGVLTYTGVKGTFFPKGGAAPGALYSYGDDAFRAGNFTATGGKAWATRHAPGSWLFRTGRGSGVVRFLRTGRCRPYNPATTNVFMFEGQALQAFGAARHGLWWKSLGGQYCTSFGRTIFPTTSRLVLSAPGQAGTRQLLLGSAGRVLEGTATLGLLGVGHATTATQLRRP